MDWRGDWGEGVRGRGVAGGVRRFSGRVMLPVLPAHLVHALKMHDADPAPRRERGSGKGEGAIPVQPARESARRGRKGDVMEAESGTDGERGKAFLLKWGARVREGRRARKGGRRGQEGSQIFMPLQQTRPGRPGRQNDPNEPHAAPARQPRLPPEAYSSPVKKRKEGNIKKAKRVSKTEN